MVSRTLPYISPEDYLEAERKAEYKSEYLDGQVYAMAGASPRHIRITSNLVIEIGSALRGGPCQIFTSDMRVRVPATRLYTYPDVSVVCGDPVFIQSDNLLNPTLIIEILSKSTERYDRTEKFLDYQSIPSLKEYLLVSQYSRDVTQCTRISADDWRIKNIDAAIGRVRLSSIGVDVTFDQIYAGVDALPG